MSAALLVPEAFYDECCVTLAGAEASLSVDELSASALETG